MAQPQTSGREWVKALGKCGWKLDGIEGSHYYMKNPVTGRRVTVPCHANEEIGKDIVRVLKRMTGLTPKRVKELS